jgi:hypothetical protein
LKHWPFQTIYCESHKKNKNMQLYNFC